jgi:hypothetical protein
MSKIKNKVIDELNKTLVKDKHIKVNEVDMEYKNLHDINTFACSDNEIYLSGTDENGDDLTIVLNAIEVLQWLDMKYIKEQSIKYIKEL